ncbi:hypothetical protein LPJ53_005854 [Coemansia erecta]|uniref:Uncharacterized protein n=1 Tax=Coemansia erecta TaxID=147472 RepID=A0A9W7XU32_9FUNG|nr:hypothetical protein LPJ53_005854 [Coemansia erecta]
MSQTDQGDRSEAGASTSSYSDRPVTAVAIARAKNKRAEAEAAGDLGRASSVVAREDTTLKESIERLERQYSDRAQRADDRLEAMERGFEDMKGMMAALLRANGGGGPGTSDQTPTLGAGRAGFDYGAVPLYETPESVRPEPTPFAGTDGGEPAGTPAGMGRNTSSSDAAIVFPNYV